MSRPTPRVRALWDRVRRPVIMFVIGAALAAPASAFIVREDAAAAGARRAEVSTRRSAAVTSSSATGGGDAAWSAERSVSTKEADVAWSAARVAGATTLHLSKAYNVPLGLATEVHKAATAAGISPRVAFGLVRTESEFRRTAVSPVGAIGYTQVMPGTAKTLRPGTSRVDLFDTRTNLELGFQYLKGLVDRYDGNIRLALTAYNRGPGIVDRLLERGRNPENGYASKVLADPASMRLTSAQRQEALAAARADVVPRAGYARATVVRRHAAHVRRAARAHVAAGSRYRARVHQATRTRHHAGATRQARPARRHAVHGRRRRR